MRKFLSALLLTLPVSLALGSASVSNRTVPITGGTFTGAVTVNDTVTATTFVGDGSQLTGLPNTGQIAASTSAIQAALDAETAARIAGDNALAVSTTAVSNDLDTEISDRYAGDLALGVATTTLQSNISNEESARIAGDNALAVSTTALQSDLSTEISNRVSGDNALAASTTTLGSDLATEISNRIAADDAIAVSTTAEAAARLAGDAGITRYANVLTVAPSGAQYTTVGAAITALGTPTALTLISVAPGTYAESPFVVPSSVTIQSIGGFAQLNFTAAPAVTISTGNNPVSFVNIGVSVTNFSGVAIKVDGSAVGNDFYPTNGVSFSNGSFLGNPGILVTGTRKIYVFNTLGFGLTNTIVTSGTSGVFVNNANLFTFASNGDTVVLGGNNTSHHFRNVHFVPHGTGKSINSSVAVTPTLMGISFNAPNNGLGSNVLSNSTATVVNSALTVNGTQFNYNLPTFTNPSGHDQASRYGDAYGLFHTSSGTVVKTHQNGYLNLTSNQASMYGYSNAGGIFNGVCSGGTEASPTACASGSIVNFIGAKPYDGTTSANGVSSSGAFTLRTAEATTPTAKGTRATIETTLIGTATRRTRVDVKDTGRVAIAPRADTVTPLGQLHLKGTDSGIGITGNGTSLYAEEAIVSLSTVEATGFYGPLTGNVTGNVSGNAATVTTNANLTGPVTSVGNTTTIVGPVPSAAIDLSTVTTGLGLKLDKTGTDALSITGATGYITTQSSITGSAFFGNGSGLTSIMRSSVTIIPNSSFTNTSFGIAIATVTLTTRGFPVAVSIVANVSNTNNDKAGYVSVLVDGAFPAELSGGKAIAATNLHNTRTAELSGTFFLEGLSAGTHSFAIVFKTEANTMSVLNDATFASQFSVRETP